MPGLAMAILKSDSLLSIHMTEIAAQPDNTDVISLDVEAFLSGTFYGVERIKQMYPAATHDGVICECDWGTYFVTDLGRIQNAAGVPVGPIPSVFRTSEAQSSCRKSKGLAVQLELI
jgi:hypothetical protein